MNNNDNLNKWLSAYIYFDGNIYSYECDLLVSRLIAPFLEKHKETNLFESYFFIRYTESGPHLRFRVFGNAEKLENEFRPEFEKHITSFFDSAIEEISRLRKSPVDKSKYFLKWTEYEPEIARYGGAEAMLVAEEYFYYSSKTAIELIKQLGIKDQSMRLGNGMVMMIITLYHFAQDINKAGYLIKMYSDGYLNSAAKEENQKDLLLQSFHNGLNKQSDKLISLVKTLWNEFEENNELPSILNEYGIGVNTIKIKLKHLFKQNKIVVYNNKQTFWDAVVLNIIPSYMHMMNNRLGISIKEESYLAYLIKAGLDSLIKNKGDNFEKRNIS